MRKIFELIYKDMIKNNRKSNGLNVVAERNLHYH